MLFAAVVSVVFVVKVFLNHTFSFVIIYFCYSILISFLSYGSHLFWSPYIKFTQPILKCINALFHMLVFYLFLAWEMLFFWFQHRKLLYWTKHYQFYLLFQSKTSLIIFLSLPSWTFVTILVYVWIYILFVTHFKSAFQKLL